MSSHREAPGISKDPVADNTDLYAFVSPDKPSTVTLIANYIPLQGPAGGPNFYEFGDDVLYEIHIDNNADALAEITYQFRFTTRVRNPNTFLYNTGPIGSLTDSSWNRPQVYSVTKVSNGEATLVGNGLLSPPCNIGPRSTPGYAALTGAAVSTLATGEKVFAGQRAEEFYVDLGAIFDLAVLRPFENLHLISTPAARGVNASNHLNVHSIAIQVPKTSLTRDGSNPTDSSSPTSVIGVWATASRRKATILNETRPGDDVKTGPFVQVSRLGNPLINEVIIPMSEKDLWNSLPPSADAQFLDDVQQPELAKLLPVLYPGVFPNLAAYTKTRADLAAILMSGIPAGVVPGFQNFTGATPADLLRLNMAVPPATTPSIFGILGGDLAGFPNGRRVTDDIVTIEVRAVAGVTIPLVDPSFTPDGAASLITSGLDPGSVTNPALASFPYLGTPYDGFDNPSS